MRQEIGSFYEIGECKTGQMERAGVAAGDMLEPWLKKAVNGMELALLCSGREAIEAALIDIERREIVKRKVCLLPRYTCDTVIIPFKKHGWELHFFSVNQGLRPDKQQFKQLLQKFVPSVLLVHTYYGVDTFSEVRDCIREQKEKGIVYIEDMTQSLPALPALAADGLADYYVGSLRKWFAIPDGAFLASGHRLNVFLEGEKRTFLELKLGAQRLKGQYIQGEDGVRKEDFLKMNGAAEKFLYEDRKVCGVSDFTRDRMRRLNVIRNFEQRKENASFLYKVVQSLRRIKAVLNMKDRSPLYVPVYTEQRDGLQEYLKRKNIFAPVLWPVPEQVKGDMDDEVKFIFENLLALPCDQRYGRNDMEKIAQCLFEYEQK